MTHKIGVILCAVLFLIQPLQGAAEERVFDYGDGSSTGLATKAWGALNAADYEAVFAYTKKCISSFSEKAAEQQASLKEIPKGEEAFSYWALNDVATCFFIRGKAYRNQNQLANAAKEFEKIIKNYPFAQCWDEGGQVFWVVADAARDQMLGMEKGVDFGDYSSAAIAEKGWKSLLSKNYEQAIIYADKCVSLYEKTAAEQQASLSDFADKKTAHDYWALNDVATCLFIKGEALRIQGQKDAALQAYGQIVEKYSFAQCWNPKGYFWKVAPGAEDKKVLIEKNIDFGHYKSFELAGKAWDALKAGDAEAVKIYAQKCVSLYEKEALNQQAMLADFPSKADANNYWALNDVATCYFIYAKSLAAQDMKEEAKNIFHKVIRKFPFAQAFDLRGWFWKVAQASKDEILMMETGIDFGDMSSATLTGKAWEALSSQEYDMCILFAKKCIETYEKEALKQQASLQMFPKKAEEYWALNDVGTCCLILGQAYSGQKKWSEARSAFEKVTKELSFSQCYDKKGWYWKVAEAARKELKKISGKR